MSTLSMIIDRLREGPVELEVDVESAFLDLKDEEFTFHGPVTGSVVFRIVGSDVLAQGELLAHARTACVRCLEQAEVELKAKVDEIWMKTEPEELVDREFTAEEPLTRSYIGDTIDLDEPFRELIMSELPDRPLCSPECKGLCQHCGANLNEEPCHCEPEAESVTEEERLPDWKQTLKKFRLEA
jgi:uncharacterized protein